MFHIVFAGRLIERKGLKVLIEAVNLLREENNNFKLHIFGEGSMLSDLQKAVTLNHAGKNILIEGFKANILDYLASAQLCVFPSLEGEGLMNVVLESMYYNGLVLTTHGNGNDEIITDGLDGFLIEPNNAQILKEKMLYVMNNFANLSQIKVNARRKIQCNFTWENHARKFDSICKKLIQEFRT